MFQALFEKLYKTLSHLIIFVKAKRLGFRSQLRKPFPCALQPALRAGAGAGSSPQALWVQQEPELGLSAHLPGPRLELCMLGAVHAGSGTAARSWGLQP